MAVKANLMFPMRAVKRFPEWIGEGSLGELARFVEDAGFDGFTFSAGASVSLITFSTNCLAASRASAAGKYTLIVTQAVSATARGGSISQRRIGVLQSVEADRDEACVKRGET